MAPERSSTEELAHETVVAGVSPVAVHRAVLFLLNSTMMLIPIWRNGGRTLCSILPHRSAVVRTETEVKQLSTLLGLLCLQY